MRSAALRARRARPTSPDGRRPRRRRAPAPRPRRGTPRAARRPRDATPVARSTGPVTAAGSRSSSASASQSSMGTITSAGPRLVSAAWYARSIAPGTSCPRAGCSTRTGYSPASPASFPARNGSYARWRRSCWPTVTTIGARFTRAVASAATALPRPAVVCRSASAGRPVPIAYPVARPITEPSCRPSTKRRSSGRPTRNGTSVEPGFAKSVVSPRRRNRSNVASRTVVSTDTAIFNLASPLRTPPPGVYHAP